MRSAAFLSSGGADGMSAYLNGLKRLVLMPCEAIRAPECRRRDEYCRYDESVSVDVPSYFQIAFVAFCDL